MNKVSEARSDARRFVMGESVKMAQQDVGFLHPNAKRTNEIRERMHMWFDPAHAGGTMLSVGGGLTLADALRGDKSFARRVAQTALGAGMLYGGYKAYTDPEWQSTMNEYGHKAYDTTRQYIMDLIGRVRSNNVSAQ